MAEQKPDLSDPDYARFAWARYRRLMTWMALAALTVHFIPANWPGLTVKEVSSASS